MSSKWHIWVIKQQKFDVIKNFLETDVPEVIDFFFPTVPREYKNGNKVYKRRIPLYSGYLFLRYEDAENKLFYKIRSNPFISNYIGICSQDSVDEMKKKEEWNVVDKRVEIGDEVQVTCGPFKGSIGFVFAINSNKVTIKVNMFDRSIDYTLLAEDLEIIKRCQEKKGKAQ